MGFLQPYLIYIVLVLTILLPLFPPPPKSFFKLSISIKNRFKIGIKHSLFFLVFFLIIIISGFNIHYENNKSIESDNNQKVTINNTFSILNKFDSTINKIVEVSTRLEKLNPRLDTLEKRTIRSINKIDTSLKLFDKYDSLQKLKFIETEPKIIIDSVLNYYDTVLDCYLIKVCYSNIGGRNASKVRSNIHFFYIETLYNDYYRYINDKNLTDERFNDINIIPSKNYPEGYGYSHSFSNGGKQKPIEGTIQIILTYYDDLLRLEHHFIERYSWFNNKTYSLFFKGIKKENSEILEEYIKNKKLMFD